MPDGSRPRWNDDRLDDFAAAIRADLADIKLQLSQNRADELKQLRERTEEAEREIDKYREEAKADAHRKAGVYLGIGIPLLCAILGSILPLIFTHAL